MKKIATTFAVLLTAFIFMFHAPSAFAGSVTANLSVSVTVDSACTVSASPLSFATYEPLGANATAPDDGQGSVTLVCTIGTSATIGLGSGLHSSAGQPFMSNAGGSSSIPYNMYQNSGRTTPWGSGGNVMTLTAATDTNEHVYPVYGRIAAGLTGLSGAYNDTVVVTVNF